MGEQIIKEGDYGISIYHIIKGEVGVFKKSDGSEICLATLGYGETIGEMIFLNRESEIRSASVRALENVELEVWHPDELSEEYEQISPVLKHITGQALNRLVRMNKIMSRAALKRKESIKSTNGTSWESHRKDYRKKLDLECRYISLNRSDDINILLKGRIRDISMGGMSMVVQKKNTSIYPHEKGELFFVDTILPNRKVFKVKAVIVSIHRGPEKLSLGMSFPELNDDKYGARKTLGFFLMPA
jgi:hypothetical protein